MSKSRRPTAPEPMPAAKPAAPASALVAVRLKPHARYGRVIVGAVAVERISAVQIARDDYERLAEEYDLELAE